MAVIDFSLIRLAAASLFAAVSVSSYHITPQSADFICTGIRQHSKEVWPRNNRLWEPGISSPHICTSCCLSNCKNLDWSRNSALHEQGIPTNSHLKLLSLKQFSAQACLFFPNSYIVMLKFAEMLKENSSSFVFLDCEKKKKREKFLQIGREKKQLMSEHRNLVHGCSAPHLWVLALTFLAPSSPKGCTECSRKEREFFKLLPHLQPHSGGKAHKRVEKRLEQTLTLHRSGDIWKDLNLNRTYRFKVDLKRKFLSSDHNNFVLLAFS